MKARVVETGQIEEFQVSELNDYFTKDGVHYKGFELDFEYEPDYWTKLHHQTSGMMLAGMLANSEWEGTYERLSECAIEAATVLVNKLKEEQK